MEGVNEYTHPGFLPALRVSTGASDDAAVRPDRGDGPDRSGGGLLLSHWSKHFDVGCHVSSLKDGTFCDAQGKYLR